MTAPLSGAAELLPSLGYQNKTGRMPMTYVCISLLPGDGVGLKAHSSSGLFLSYLKG